MVLGVILIGSLFVKRRMRYRRTGKENQILVKKIAAVKGELTSILHLEKPTRLESIA